MMDSEFMFQYWLVAHFDHPYSYGNFIDIEDLEISSQQHIEFVTRVFNDAEALLAPYSNDQINQTLWYLATNLHDLSDKYGGDVDWKIRKTCIQSFKALNELIFAKRCSPETSAYKTIALDNRLNSICYMWWDIFAFWESIETDSSNRVDAEFLDVMAYCLDIDHIAVIEGALHGLSHIPNHRQQVISLIDNFLDKNPELQSDLVSYANAAKFRANL